MRLTPLDIRKQEFSHGFRGYDDEEVNAFLQMVANQWEELQDENRRREEKIRELENKLVHYQNVEEALQEALQTARESSRKALANAEEKAEMIVSQAMARAEDVTREAEQERHELKRETVRLSGRRSEIVTRLRAFLMSEMELLARYEGDDPVGFIRLHGAEEQRFRRLSERLEEDEASERRKSAQSGRREDRRSAWDEPVDEEGPLHIDPEADSPSKGPEASDRARRDEPRSDVEGGAEASIPASRPETSTSEGRRDAAAFERSQPASEFPAGRESESGPDVAAGTAEGPAQLDRPQTSGLDDDGSSEDAERDVTQHDRPERDEEQEVRGWTTRTVVSRLAEQERSRARKRGEDDYEGERDDETDTRDSSGEIEKIRRILSDLE